MNCPSPIAQILLNILQTGILRTRAAAWGGDLNQAGAEADHIHNIPALLKDYSPDLLRFYWDTERPRFISEVADVAAFEELWRNLRTFVASLDQPMPVP